jgi:hypothetical protein
VSGSPVQKCPGGQLNEPESAPNEAALSADVQTTTSLDEEAAVFPSVNPLMVTVKNEMGRTAAFVVIIKSRRLVGKHDIISPVTFVAPAATNGTTPNSKKSRGYATVMLLFAAISTVVWKDSVSATFDFIEILSEDEITNDTECT